MTVIVADDSPIQLAISKNSFRELTEFQVIGAYLDGASAFAAIVRDKPDVALLDYVMPQLTGAEVIAKVREAGCKTQCIFATSMGQEGGAYAHGVPVIVKPFSPALLRIALHKLGLV